MINNAIPLCMFDVHIYKDKECVFCNSKEEESRTEGDIDYVEIAKAEAEDYLEILLGGMFK